MEQFGYADKDFPFFRTLHSIAFRELDLSRNEVISKEDYREFSDKMGMHFTGYYTEDLHHNDDLYLFYDEMYRNNPRAANVFLSQLDINKLRYVRSNYVRFKREKEIWDYTDMIERFCEGKMDIPVRVGFIDEAQDLTTLQWRMVWTMLRHCERVYIAGDDDQAIYQWSGADVNYFLGVEGEVNILKHSYRLPDEILRYAKRITKQIGKRVDKDYEGTGGGGIVEEHNSLEDIPIKKDETYMFLSRNNAFLDEVEEFAMSKSLIYSRKGKISASKDDYSAIKRYEECRARGSLTDKDRAALGVYTKNDYNLKDPWYESFCWKPERIMYFRDLVANKVRVDDNRTYIGTIHSVKGAEADNVVVLLDITKNVLTNLQNNPDSEHRVFYVGCTRAKKELHVVHSRSRYGYSIY